MKKIIWLMLFALASVSFLSAQGLPNINEEMKNKTIKADFVVGDIVFAYNSLNTINIQGSEVDAFLEVKEELKKTTDKIEAGEMKIDDKINMEINSIIANNLMIFMQRITIQGANAERFKRFRNTMFDAAKNL